jgi:hypothetical protein
MTTPHAIAAVTAVLRRGITAYLTAAGVTSSVGGVSVTALPPDRLVTGQQEKNQVNLFMHRVSHNPGWVNRGVPPRDGSGARVAAPPLALDLHYVLSAYGQDLFTAEILLGHALMALHQEPVLGPDRIRAALVPSPPDPSVPAGVAASRLADQVERIRLSPVSPGGEEVARLWSAFSGPYRPSAFFDASVVLIDDDRAFRAAFPVREVTAGSTGIDGPRVDGVSALGPAGTPVTATATLAITGARLAAEGTTVRLARSVAPPVGTDRELEVPIASFAPPVRAGYAGLVVVRELPLGSPPTGHEVLTSAAVPVAVRPTIAFAAGAVVRTANRTLDGVAVSTGRVTVGFTPPVGVEQQVTLLLSGAPPGTASATLGAPVGNGVAPGGTETASIVFPFSDVPRGDYVARARVDGVESPLSAGPTGEYALPAVTV